jgi:hypothetical protein
VDAGLRINAYPEKSTATQKVLEAHETAVMWLESTPRLARYLHGDSADIGGDGTALGPASRSDHYES